MKFKELSAGEISKSALLILQHEYKGVVWRQNNVRAVRGRTFTGRKGVADIQGFQKETGKMILAEVKKIGDTFKKEQIELLTDLHNNGGIALWATQEGLKVVVKKFIS